jgi:hypothetical protein
VKDSLNPANITGAAFIAQFAIIVIMFIGAAILHKAEGKATFFYGRRRFPQLVWYIVVFALLTIGCLLFSDEFSKLWRPLLEDASIPTMPWRLAVVVMFLSDIVLVTILVFYTDGSKDSPLGPLYFLLPTLAILLREPLERLVLYVSLTIISFSIMLYLNFAINRFAIKPDNEQTNRPTAYLTVSISCFILATFIGWVTRIK